MSRAGPIEDSNSIRGARQTTWALTASSLAAALGCAAVAWNDGMQREWLAATWLYRSPHALDVLNGLAVLAALASAANVLAARRGWLEGALHSAIRWAVVVGSAAWLALWLGPQPQVRHDFHVALAGSAASWSTLVAVSAWSRRGVRSARVARVEQIVLACAISIVGAECGLRLVRAVAHPQLLATPGADIDAWIRANRRPPGSIIGGIRADSAGFVDEEPSALGPNSPWVACIGDSFSVGVVPHFRHYTTLAEKLVELPIYNIGVVYAGPREYLAMLRQNALPRAPRLVVIALFLGNDLDDALRGDAVDTLTSWTTPSEVLLSVAARRGWAVATRGPAQAPDANARGVVLTPEQIERSSRATPDPRVESPTFSQERFDYIEQGRASNLLADTSGRYEALYRWLRELRAAAAPIPVACLLFPDEFQVEDAVWERVVAGGIDPSLDRAAPQRAIGAWLESEGIAYEDVLPRLLAVAPMEDGRRHVYHLRDSHFNARGNAVAAQALADLIRRFDLR